ncbi:putative cytochrome P450 [Helianthus annuus]|uniref:Cytochrome P450 n=2 Tax=Helianthus annuus TaxID=4232 RepID=A0A251UW50_HELAN|nr:putative cytochrome P450 [Helianthus annuus]KAJ0595760.1 putative cytochrome P450 [Helianthus annuus]KAJ0756418.1 putative cytochrome P450 [Helianthus annuus]KAJ0925386.1 putative cytochrome P450 [Helianthus annuus]
MKQELIRVIEIHYYIFRRCLYEALEHNKSQNLLASKIMEIFSSSETLLLSSFSCIVIVIFICMKWILFDSRNRKNIPPSPQKLPIIGNIHHLGSSPNRNLQILSQKYGPLILLRLGSIPTLVASSAEAAHEIMKTHDLSFCSRPSIFAPNILLYGSKSIVFSPYGEYWRRLKSLVVLKLLSNIRVKSYKKVRENEIVHMIQMLRESCGTTIDMGSMFTSLTNNIISRIALGRKLDGPKYQKLLREFVDMFSVFCIGNYFPWLSWVDQVTGTVRRAKKIAKEFDEFLESIIEEHVNKKKGEDANSNEEGEDFVDILLDLQKDNTSAFALQRDTLKALIMEAFAAGTETTQTSLEWAMSELIRNPRVMKKLQQEVTEIAQGRSMISEEDLERMSYLKAVVKESLRLHTPFPLLLPRESVQDVKLMGFDIAAGTQVIINAWAIARDPSLWEEPNEFRPERFLNNSINYQGLHFEWIPFGAGRRSCPGIQFSVPVMELALANIVYKFDIVLPNGIKSEDLDMTEAFGITIHRKSSLIVSVSPRF